MCKCEHECAVCSAGLEQRAQRALSSCSAAERTKITQQAGLCTFMRCLLTHFVNVFFCTLSRSSVKRKMVEETAEKRGRGEKKGGREIGLIM